MDSIEEARKSLILRQPSRSFSYSRKHTSTQTQLAVDLLVFQVRDLHRQVNSPHQRGPPTDHINWNVFYGRICF